MTKSVTRPTARPINAPMPAPIGPPTIPIIAPMPAPVAVAPAPISNALKPSIPFLIASQTPVINAGIPATMPPIAPPSNALPKALPIRAPPAASVPPPPIISPRLFRLRPSFKVSLIPSTSIVIPVIANVTPNAKDIAPDFFLIDSIMPFNPPAFIIALFKSNKKFVSLRPAITAITSVITSFTVSQLSLHQSKAVFIPLTAVSTALRLFSEVAKSIIFSIAIAAASTTFSSAVFKPLTIFLTFSTFLESFAKAFILSITL